MSTRTTLELALPLLLAVVFYFALERTDIDERVTDLFFSRTGLPWPYRQSWLFGTVLHDLGATALAAVPTFYGLRALSAVFTARWRRSWRSDLFIAVCMGGTALLIGMLKLVFMRPCPWQVDRYGGSMPRVSLFAHPPPEMVADIGFPAAHAGFAFGLFAFYFVFRDRDAPRARLWFWTAFVVGNLFGFVQIVRGAHFLSHQCWSGILVWYLCWAIHRFAFRSRLGPTRWDR